LSGQVNRHRRRNHLDEHVERRIASPLLDVMNVTSSGDPVG
jgi:hypothetical protein